MKNIIPLCIPAAFCAFISLMSLVTMHFQPTAWQPAFFAFLPMCFVFVAMAMWNMRTEIVSLQNKLKAIEAKAA